MAVLAVLLPVALLVLILALGRLEEIMLTPPQPPQSPPSGAPGASGPAGEGDAPAPERTSPAVTAD